MNYNGISIVMPGEVPEKDFVVINSKSTEGVHDWQEKLANCYQEQNSIAYLDNNYDSETCYATPLTLDVQVITHENPILIKQVKAIQDALSGIAYLDDAYIAELLVRKDRNYDLEPKCYIDIYPAYAELCKRDDPCTHIVSGHFRTIQDTDYAAEGYSKKKENKDKDELMAQRIREDWQGERIKGLWRFTAEYETAQITKSMYPQFRKMMVERKILPTQKPDVDNLVYTTLRALNDIAYDDIRDCQQIHATKFYTPAEEKEYKEHKLWFEKI